MTLRTCLFLIVILASAAALTGCGNGVAPSEAGVAQPRYWRAHVADPVRGDTESDPADRPESTTM